MHVRPVSRELRKQVRRVGQEAVGVAVPRAELVVGAHLVDCWRNPPPTFVLPHQAPTPPLYLERQRE